MDGGKITVHGNVNDDIATLAEGGTVELLGNYARICPFTKARISHKGNLVNVK